ncbi:hypothetical protein Tco_0305431 [Tanacetum coccineum]
MSSALSSCVSSMRDFKELILAIDNHCASSKPSLAIVSATFMGSIGRCQMARAEFWLGKIAGGGGMCYHGSWRRTAEEKMVKRPEQRISHKDERQAKNKTDHGMEKVLFVKRPKAKSKPKVQSCP